MLCLAPVVRSQGWRQASILPILGACTAPSCVLGLLGGHRLCRALGPRRFLQLVGLLVPPCALCLLLAPLSPAALAGALAIPGLATYAPLLLARLVAARYASQLAQASSLVLVQASLGSAVASPAFSLAFDAHARGTSAMRPFAIAAACLLAATAPYLSCVSEILPSEISEILPSEIAISEMSTSGPLRLAGPPPPAECEADGGVQRTFVLLGGDPAVQLKSTDQHGGTIRV